MAETTVEAKEPKEVFTVTETANFLGVCKTTVYKMVRQGKLPGRMIGNRLRFSKKALEGFLAITGKQKSTP